MQVKNTIPEYQNPKERDILLQKQYNLLQRRIYESKKKKQSEEKDGRR